jgi:antitoxin component YwqK of YwqJK toxin-antitoxin module
LEIKGSWPPPGYLGRSHIFIPSEKNRHMMPRITVLLLAVSLFVSDARAEPPTVEQLKEAFTKAIVASGYKVGDTTKAVIEREAPRIAATLEDMKNVQLYVEKVNGVEHGFCYALYSNDQIQRMGYYAKGKRVGPWRFYFPDGTLATKLQYNIDGEEIGQHVAYLRNGDVHYVETYADGVKHGPKTTFYEDGSTHMHQMWQHGRMHGFSIIYYPTGIVKQFASWANGQQHGTVILYDESGQLTEQTQYVNGQKQ